MSDTQDYFEPDDDVTLPNDDRVDPPAFRFRPGEAFGRYVLLDTLGRGGMGLVLSAYDTVLARRVALKLVLAGTSDRENRVRLSREAQSLAKLSHPAIVRVFDVGELQGHVFIAMEFIDGPNARTWLRTHPRSRAEILAVYRDAAVGLQAAHDAGIIHRDFKPDNVLIGPDGRARVTDFGLALDARVAAQASDANGWSESDRVTRVGTVMGTPPYMPVEQHRGRAVDHRCDQFSFCVALYEALAGVRPFTGNTPTEYCKAIEAREIPRSTAIPRRLHQALARGLSPTPEHRFQSMRALIRALQPRRKRTWVVVGLCGLSVGAAVTAFGDSSKPCTAFDERVLAVFSDADKARIHDAFEATELPHASTSAKATLQSLDEYATHWVAQAEEACHTNARGEQSDRALDLRTQCLDRRLAALSGLVEMLGDVQRNEVASAPDNVSELPDIALCVDIEALRQLDVLPSSKGHAHDATALLPILDRIRARIVARRFSEASALLDQHRAEFDASTYPPVTALFRSVQGRLDFEAGNLELADTRLREALTLALEHHLQHVATRTAVELGIIARKISNVDDALVWFERAGALARASESATLRAFVLLNSANSLRDAGRQDEAIDALRRATELANDSPTYPRRARVELQLTYSQHLFDRLGKDAGLDALVRAKREVVELGGDPMLLARITTEFVRRSSLRGDHQAAATHSADALVLARKAYGPRSTAVAAALINTGIAYKNAGDLEEAIRRLNSAQALLETLQGVTFQQAIVLSTIADTYASAGRTTEARAAVDVLSAFLDDHEAQMQNRFPEVNRELALAAVLRLEGDLDAARVHAERALELVRDASPSAEHEAHVISMLASIECDAGHLQRAGALAEQALQHVPESPDVRARALFVQARVAWTNNIEGQRPLALARARTALDEFARAPAYTHERETVRAWLQERETSRPSTTTASD